MKYNPDIHQRRSIRLKPYDYVQTGAYFITICAYERTCLFGEITHGTMNHNAFGNAVVDAWNDLPNHHPIETGVSVVMPNHVHGIIHVGAQPAVPKSTSRHTPARAQQAAPLQHRQPIIIS